MVVLTPEILKRVPGRSGPTSQSLETLELWVVLGKVRP